MKKLVLTAAMLVCLLGSGCCNVLTVKVVDAETGVPITKASVMLRQAKPLGPGNGWGYGKEKEWTMTTDANGRCTFVKDIDNSMKLMVWKSGPEAYYMGRGDWYRLGSHDEPWPVESVTMRLKKRGASHRMSRHWIRLTKNSPWGGKNRGLSPFQFQMFSCFKFSSSVCPLLSISDEFCTGQY